MAEGKTTLCFIVLAVVLGFLCLLGGKYLYIFNAEKYLTTYLVTYILVESRAVEGLKISGCASSN